MAAAGGGAGAVAVAHGDGTRGQDCRVLRSILVDLTPKKDAFPTRIFQCFQAAGFNDNFLRAMTGETIQNATGCTQEFARSVEFKILQKLRSEGSTKRSEDRYPLPPPASAASQQDIGDAVELFKASGEISQRDVILKFFKERNVNIQPSTLSRKLHLSRKVGAGRNQLLEDWICRDIITPALIQFRSIGKTKWKIQLRMLMKQLLRAQKGIGPVHGIMELVRLRQSSNISGVASSQSQIQALEDEDEDDSDESRSTASAGSDATDLGDDDEIPQQGDRDSLPIRDGGDGLEFKADRAMDPSTEFLQLEDMRKRMRQHASNNGKLTKVLHGEFPGTKTLARYMELYGWTQRKIELLHPHRQNGASPTRITENYSELERQYEMHDIAHPNQIIVCDELRWCKEWGDILDFIKGICESACKRSQGDGPARIKDGVTVCPFVSIIGHIYLVQVIVKKKNRLNARDIIAILTKNGFDASSVMVSVTESGYQTAESFREAIEALIVVLHVAEGGQGINANIESIRLRRKYINIADGSSTHPFHDIHFSCTVAIAGLFFHQQEPDSTHVCNLQDRFCFLLTKLYSAKEVMMHLAIKFSPKVTNDTQATAWIEEIIASLAKTIDISSDVCPADLSITDPAVLLKFDTILKCRDSSFDVMHLMECIIPALYKGMQPAVTIASAKAVGLLPKGFKITSGFDYAANVELWRGPWVEQVLKQSCVQGQMEREARVQEFNADKKKSVQQAMTNFGFDIFGAGLENGAPIVRYFPNTPDS